MSPRSLRFFGTDNVNHHPLLVVAQPAFGGVRDLSGVTVALICQFFDRFHWSVFASEVRKGSHLFWLLNRVGAARIVCKAAYLIIV